MTRSAYPTGPRWAGLGVNYGSDVAYDTPFRTSTVQQDLAIITRNFSGIRLHIPPPTTSTAVINNLLAIAQLARAFGLKVLWGSTANGGPTLTAGNWSTYEAAVLARAALAQQHNIDNFTVGNEDEYRIDGTTLPAAAFRSNIQTLASKVKLVYSGSVSYTVSHNHTFEWIALGKGPLDNLGLNVYGSDQYDQRFFIYILSTFYKAFGANMYIAEFNITDNWGALTMSEAEKYNYLRMRLAYIRRLGVSEAYFFVYSHRVDDQFSLRLSSGDFSPMWWAISQNRRSFVGLPNQPVWQTRTAR